MLTSALSGSSYTNEIGLFEYIYIIIIIIIIHISSPTLRPSIAITLLY